MIISHKHRFIFVRTRKVASSSMEIVLSKLLGAEDFVTRQTDRDRLTPGVMKDHKSRLFGGLDRKWSPIFFHGHAPLSTAYRYFGNAIKDYLVFTVERNPWDRAISTYYWSRRHTKIKQEPLQAQIADFRSYLQTNRSRQWLYNATGINRHRAPSQSWMYSLEDVPVVDMIVRYEFLEQDLNELGQKLGLEGGLSLDGVFAKGDVRPKKEATIEDYYDEASHEIIRQGCAWEVEALGYTGPSAKPTPYQPVPNRQEIKQQFIHSYGKK